MTEAVRPGQGVVQAAIARAAQATGVDFSLLVETARRESALDPGARAQTSSARGLFQFIDSTWLDMVRRHGAEHGLGAYAAQVETRNGRSTVSDPAARAAILALRDDPEISARMAGELTRENAQFLTQRLGRAPSAGELYAAHVLGADGAARLATAASRNEPDAAQLFPVAAAVNRGLFFADGAPRSAAALLDRLSLDAGAAIAPATNEGAAPELAGAPMSPALAHALFAMAVLPLLSSSREDDGERQSPFSALAAYARVASAT